MAANVYPPDFSSILETPTDSSTFSDGIYVAGKSEEDRESWLRRTPSLSVVDVVKQEDTSFAWTRSGSIHEDCWLRSLNQLKGFWDQQKASKIYLDITSLGHHVWAPLLRTAIGMHLDVIVLYAEPNDYRKNITPTEGQIFDLSLSIQGIAPIPGFASLADEFENRECFIPLLGFEGNRLAHMVEHVQPERGKMIPVIGVPGFRAEYVFHAFHGNRVALSETQSWKQVRFAPANSPFALCYLLETVADEHPSDLLKIAPIGTKPHALGAFLFAIRARRQVEFIYDFPIRRPKRTSGVSRVFAYDVTKFLSIQR
jgi:hypothetical protein